MELEELEKVGLTVLDEDLRIHWEKCFRRYAVNEMNMILMVQQLRELQKKIQKL